VTPQVVLVVIDMQERLFDAMRRVTPSTRARERSDHGD